MNRRLRWLLGLLIIIALFVGIIFYPPASLLEWQSISLMRFFFILSLCCVFCLYRIMRGPTPADRVVSIDILGGLCRVSLLLLPWLNTLKEGDLRNNDRNNCVRIHRRWTHV